MGVEKTTRNGDGVPKKQTVKRRRVVAKDLLIKARALNCATIPLLRDKYSKRQERKKWPCPDVMARITV